MSFIADVDGYISECFNSSRVPSIEDLNEVEVGGPAYTPPVGPVGVRNIAAPGATVDRPRFPSAGTRQFVPAAFSNANRAVPPAIFGGSAMAHEDIDGEAFEAVLGDLEELMSGE